AFVQRLRHTVPQDEFEEGPRHRGGFAATGGKSLMPAANNSRPDPSPLAGEGKVKRSMPSLIGGVFSAVVVFVLWLLLFGTASIPMIALGLVIAAALGTWIRLADL